MRVARDDKVAAERSPVIWSVLSHVSVVYCYKTAYQVRRMLIGNRMPPFVMQRFALFIPRLTSSHNLILQAFACRQVRGIDLNTLDLRIDRNTPPIDKNRKTGLRLVDRTPARNPPPDQLNATMSNSTDFHRIYRLSHQSLKWRLASGKKSHFDLIALATFSR